MFVVLSAADVSMQVSKIRTKGAAMSEWRGGRDGGNMAISLTKRQQESKPGDQNKLVSLFQVFH